MASDLSYDYRKKSHKKGRKLINGRKKELKNTVVQISVVMIFFSMQCIDYR